MGQRTNQQEVKKYFELWVYDTAKVVLREKYIAFFFANIYWILCVKDNTQHYS